RVSRSGCAARIYNLSRLVKNRVTGIFVGTAFGIVQHIESALLRSCIRPAFAHPVKGTAAGAARGGGINLLPSFVKDRIAGILVRQLFGIIQNRKGSELGGSIAPRLSHPVEGAVARRAS